MFKVVERVTANTTTITPHHVHHDYHYRQYHDHPSLLQPLLATPTPTPHTTPTPTVREELLGISNAVRPIPAVLDYQITADKKSVHNTPPVFWYVGG